MANEANNYEKNKYNAQIRGDQVSNLEKEKSNNKLAEKIEKGLNIHSMPNDFRQGKFNSSVHPNDINNSKKDTPKGKHKHKYVGVLIIVFGILVLGALAYFIYDYINQDLDNNTVVEMENNNISNNEEPEDNEPDTSQENDNNQEVQSDDLEDAVNQGDGSLEEEIIVDEEEDFMDDIENSTSTEEVATSTEETNLDTSTSTPEIIAVKDTDGDSLTDAEEHLLNTNINLEDSDSDTYTDASEVVSLYNPAGSNSLVDNPAISQYSNPLLAYSILYPKSWTQRVNNGGESVMFMNDNEGFFQISTEPNEESLNIEQWYRQEFALEDGDEIEYFSENEEKIVSNDGLVVYFADQNNIYVFSYTVMSASPSYPNIFKAFVNSFTRY